MAAKKQKKVLAEVLYYGLSKSGKPSTKILQRKKITTTTALSIGRSRSCDFVISSPKVAPVHSLITALASDHNAILMVDVDTKSGSLKEGVSRYVHYLRKGDEVLIAAGHRFIIK